MSKITSFKEFNVLSILYKNKFPVPKPYGYNRHVILMKKIDGVLLKNLKSIKDPKKLCSSLFNTIIRFAKFGFIHGDFNEFNIIMMDDENFTIIDFPQIISINHKMAKEFFERDVNSIINFFSKKFNYQAIEIPIFEKIEVNSELEIKFKTNGFMLKEQWIKKN